MELLQICLTDVEKAKSYEVLYKASVRAEPAAKYDFLEIENHRKLS